jgi:hypothetical protein
LYSTAPYTLTTLNRINYHRYLAGTAPVALQPQISAAAQAHASYLSLHQNAAHEESSGLSGYTGQWAWNRMENQGYSYSAAGEVISFGKDAQGGVDALITAIYHRFALLDPGYTEAGIGDAPHTFYTMCQVINLGRPSGVGAATNAVAIYPAAGQGEVPTSFDSDSESPDPMPAAGLVGYPVSIQFSGEQSVTLASFTLSKGITPVSTTLLSPTTDSNIQQSNKKNFSLIPNSPLQAATLYQVLFSATVQGQPYSAAWSFTTAAASALTVTPNPATFAMGQVGELVISGGSGSGYGVSWSDGSKFSLAFQGDTMLITPLATGTATLTLTDSGTQAKVQVPITITNGPAPLSVSRALTTGWNLLALPLTPTNTAVTSVLGGISTQVISAWKWTGATWAVLLPGTDDAGAQFAADKGFTLLQALNPGEGFWINASSATTFTCSGMAPANATLSLQQGWNLVGTKTLKPSPVGDLAYLADATIISLWAWNGVTWAVTLPAESDGGAEYAAAKGFYLLQTIKPGEGFWAHVQ